MFNLSLILGMKSVVEIMGELPSIDITLCSDSRGFLKGELFVAIPGDLHDGFEFIPSILDKGGKYFVCESSEERGLLLKKYFEKYSDVTFVIVNSVMTFLAELSNRRIVEWKNNGGMVIGITGSNGKTTHKEMLLHFFKTIVGDKIIATEGNLNNHWGVPFTILKIEDKHQYAIIEMGSNHPGEIQYLTNIALPDAGIITNIGDSHLEFFKNRDNVFIEKRSLFDGITCSTNPKKVFVYSSEDLYLRQLPRYEWSISHGEHDANVITRYSRGEIIVDDVRLKNHNLIGKHNFSNLASCFLLASHILGQKESLVEVASTFNMKMNRAEIVSRGKTKIFLDAYNANPSSMIASLNAVIDDGVFDVDNSLFVLGDMNELGDATSDKHKIVGAVCRSKGIKNILFVGRFSEDYLQGWGGAALHYNNTLALLEEWPKIASKYSQIFIKGSRTLQLESLADIKYYYNN